MSQPPNPPSGATPPQPPGGWNPQPGAQPGGTWGTDPTQPLPAGQQYPPTLPLPAGGDPAAGPYGPPPTGVPYPAAGMPYGPPDGGVPGAGTPGVGTPGAAGVPGPDGPFGAHAASGQPGGYPPGAAGGGYNAPGQNGAGGPYGAGGGYGGGGGFGAGGPAPGGGPGGRNPAPLIIGIVAGVLVLGLLAWFLFLRPGGSATPATSPSPSASATRSVPPSVSLSPSVGPSSTVPSVSPSGSVSPSASVSPRPSGTTTASCSALLSKTQCDWAVYLRAFVQISTCRPDLSDTRRDAFTCRANPRGTLEGDATVTMRWADDSKDLTALMTDFFDRAGVDKDDLGANWRKPPAHTNWWYTDKPKEILGKLGSADADNGDGRVAWTFSKQRFFVEASSDGDDAKKVLAWWAKS